MKANEAKLLDFLKKTPQFVIPIYQRTYSWGERECEQLWLDILRAGDSNEITAHFVGSVVHIQQDQATATMWSPLMVIDGQQRLTTVSLILAALAAHVGDSEPEDGFSARKVRHYYLSNSEESGERRFKLLLSQTDKASLCAIVDQQPKPHEFSIRIHENFDYFARKLQEAKHKLSVVCRGISKLMIVDVSLTRGQDNPQLVFESLNSTGRKLSQADLIRNFVLMSLEPDLQTRLYESYWRPMEVDFGQEGYLAYFDSFMRDYLTYRTGELPNVGNVYEAFKKYAKSSKVTDTESLLKDIRRFSGFYCSMALGKEPDSDLKAAFHDLRELRVEVAYPLLLELYEDYDEGTLTRSDFLKAIRLVESYVFRRSVCAIPTNSLNLTFATFGRDMKEDRYLESIQAKFLSLPSYRRFPSDEEFRRELQSRDLYNFRSRAYWLRKLENHERKERVPVDEYTIEHILPQSDNDPNKVPSAWRSMLGEEWQRVWEQFRHTLGNLTLTGYNSEYSNRPFGEKRTMTGGFAESPLRLNAALANLEEWNEEQIVKRAHDLSGKALKVWPAPVVDPSILEAYRDTTAKTGHSIDDHPQLVSGPMKEVFEAVRKEILGIDPVVTEEFLKLYVAYKAETNFVDIVPQAKRLWLTINIPFAELNDPKGLAVDITDRGRWGNGDVRYSLESVEGIPYAMSLIRQAFDRQMGAVEA